MDQVKWDGETDILILFLKEEKTRTADSNFPVGSVYNIFASKAFFFFLFFFFANAII